MAKGRVGLLYHPRVRESQRLARALVEVVQACDYEAWVESAWAREGIVAQSDSCDVLVTMGGDGTILRVARAVLPTRATRELSEAHLAEHYTLVDTAQLADVVRPQTIEIWAAKP